MVILLSQSFLNTIINPHYHKTHIFLMDYVSPDRYVHIWSTKCLFVDE